MVTNDIYILRKAVAPSVMEGTRHRIIAPVTPNTNVPFPKAPCATQGHVQ